MPSITNIPSDEVFEVTESFAVLKCDFPPIDDRRMLSKDQPRPLKNVNIVKPVLRAQPQEDYSFKVIDDEFETDKRRKRRSVEPIPQSNTILDPHFSRRLDLKLRRLKEKEIIAERLSRRSRERQRTEPNIIPKINVKKVSELKSTSQPNLSTAIKPNLINLEIPSRNSRRSPEIGSSGKSPDRSNLAGNRSKKGSKMNVGISPTNERPLFITTVKKGEFLPPPASMATLLGMSGCERTGGVAGIPTLMYSYASKPKVVGGTTPKTVEKGTGTSRGALATLASIAVAAVGLRGRSTYGNLMTDRRILRGSVANYQANHASLLDGENLEKLAAARGAIRQRAMARRRGNTIPGFPGTTAPRKHEPVQTDPYLEELYEKGKEIEIGVQTDLFLEPPEIAPYVPACTVNEVATQILPGELFHFDTEVEPILEVLVDKTIEEAIAECLEEEELAFFRKQATAEKEYRTAQVVASARHRKRLKVQNEKERNIEEDGEENEDKKKPDQHSVAAALLKAHLPQLLPAVLDTLKEQGYVTDPHTEMEESFSQWLVSEVTQEVENMLTNKEVLIDIVKEIIETRAELYRAMGEDETVEISSSNQSDFPSNETQKNEEENIETKNEAEIVEH